MIMNDPRGNPFATRHTHPGAIPFFFPAGTTLKGLVRRLAQSNGRGEIVGGHGSGKSTLLAHLLEALEEVGQRPLRFTLRDGQRRLPSQWKDAADKATSLAIDGYEQLSFLSRWRLKRHCRRNGLGLLVTAHTTTGLPTLYRTSCDVDVARRIVSHLLRREHPASFSAEEIPRLLQAHHGNLREMLFSLYDHFEEGKARDESGGTKVKGQESSG